ncbi:MAG: DUF5309 family protein [Bacteroidetes bacterium]|nr:DUF5309 family protein [Bacteroidota bacterium]
MNKKQKLIIVIIVLAFLALLCVLFGVSIESAMAFSAIVGVPATTVNADENSSINREDISESVIQMMPSRTPLDTILRNVKKSVSAKSQKVGYYEASYKPIEDKINLSATGIGSSISSPTLSNTVASSNQLTSIYVKISNPDMWRKNDTLLMQNLNLSGKRGSSRFGDSGSFEEDVMFYVFAKEDCSLGLKPIGGMLGKLGTDFEDKYIVPSFLKTTKIVRLGQAKSELSITTEPFAIYPTLSHQYCQNFMAQIEESTFQRLTQKEANWGFSNFEAVNILSMKMEMELSMLFGQQGEITQGNDRTYFTRGITRDIDTILEYGKGSDDRSITKDQYSTWIKKVFDGNNGSTTRVLFAGSGLIKSLSLVDEFQKNMLAVEKDATLGIDVRKIHTYFGTLNIVFAPLFKNAGWEDCGLILDIEHLTKHEFVPMSVTDLDLKSSGQKNADARVIQEVSCLTLRYPD